MSSLVIYLFMSALRELAAFLLCSAEQPSTPAQQEVLKGRRKGEGRLLPTEQDKQRPWCWHQTKDSTGALGCFLASRALHNGSLVKVAAPFSVFPVALLFHTHPAPHSPPAAWLTRNYPRGLAFTYFLWEVFPDTHRHRSHSTLYFILTGPCHAGWDVPPCSSLWCPWWWGPVSVAFASPCHRTGTF